MTVRTIGMLAARRPSLVAPRPPRDIPAISEEDLMRGYGLIEPMSLLEVRQRIHAARVLAAEAERKAMG